MKEFINFLIIENIVTIKSNVQNQIRQENIQKSRQMIDNFEKVEIPSQQQQIELQILINQVSKYLGQAQLDNPNNHSQNQQPNIKCLKAQIKGSYCYSIVREYLQKLFAAVQQKDQMIINLGQKLTKQKCQAINHAKTISSLQEKLNKLQPNLNNTGSNFMMPSQFKDCFENFMNSHLTVALDPFLQIQQTNQIPIIFSDVVKAIFKSHYLFVQQKLAQILSKMANVLNLNGNSSKQCQQSIFNNLLRVFQDNWKSMFPHQNISIQYSLKFVKKYRKEIQEMNQSQQFMQMSRQLHKICVYMNLQQKKWNFLWQPLQRQNQSSETKKNGKRVIDFDKKEFICLDGFVKENSRAIVVLQGLIRQQHKHAGIKSYVLPYNQGESESLREQSLIQRQNANSDMQMQNQNSVLQQCFKLNLKAHQSVVNKIQKQDQVSQQKEKETKNQYIKQVKNDKFQEKIIKLEKQEQQQKDKQNLDKVQIQVQERERLTLHKILMERNKRQSTHKLKEETKINNWVSQKKKELNCNFGHLRDKQWNQNQVYKSRQKALSKQKSVIKGVNKGNRKKGISQVNLSNALQKVQYSRSRQQIMVLKSQYQFISQKSEKQTIKNQDVQNVSPNLFVGKSKTRNTDNKNFKNIDRQLQLKDKNNPNFSPKLSRTDSSKAIKPENSQKNFKKLYHDNIISKAEKTKKDERILQRKRSIKQLEDEFPEFCFDKLKHIDETEYEIARLKKLRKDMAKGTLNNFKVLKQKARINSKEQENQMPQRKQNVQLNIKKTNRNQKKASIGKIVSQNPNPSEKYHDIIKSSIFNSQIVKALTVTERDQNRPLKSNKLRTKYLG